MARGSGNEASNSQTSSGSLTSGRPTTSAERMRNYRARKKQEKTLTEGHHQEVQREQWRERKRRQRMKQKQVEGTPPEELFVEQGINEDTSKHEQEFNHSLISSGCSSVGTVTLDAESESISDNSSSMEALISAFYSPSSSGYPESGRPLTPAERMRNYRARLKWEKENKQIGKEILREQWRERKKRQRMKQKQVKTTSKEESSVPLCDNSTNSDAQKHEHELNPSSAIRYGSGVDTSTSFTLDALVQSPANLGDTSAKKPLTSAERMRKYREKQKKKKKEGQKGMEKPPLQVKGLTVEKQEIEKSVVIVREKSDVSLSHGQAENSCESENVIKTSHEGQLSTGCILPRRPLTPAERTRNYRERQKEKASLGVTSTTQREKWRDSKRKSRSRQKQPTTIKFEWNSSNMDEPNSSRSTTEEISFHPQAQDSSEGRRALTAAEKQRRYREKLKQSPEKWAEYKKRGLLASRKNRQYYSQLLQNSGEETQIYVESGMNGHIWGNCDEVGLQSTTVGSNIVAVSRNGNDSPCLDNPGAFQKRRKRVSKYDVKEQGNQTLQEVIDRKRAMARERTRRYRQKQKMKNNQNDSPTTVENNRQNSRGRKTLLPKMALNGNAHPNQLYYIVHQGSALSYGLLPSIISNPMPSFQQTGTTLSDVQTLPFQTRNTPETTCTTEDPSAQKRAKARERTRRYRLKQKAKTDVSNQAIPAEPLEGDDQCDVKPAIKAAMDRHHSNAGQMLEVQRRANSNNFVSELHGESVPHQMFPNDCPDTFTGTNVNDSEMVVYPEDILDNSLPAAESDEEVSSIYGLSAGYNWYSSRAMTPAERQRRYRERLRQSPDKFAVYRQKQHQRYLCDKANRTQDQQNRIRSLSVVRSRNYRNRRRHKELVDLSSDRSNVAAMQSSSGEIAEDAETAGEAVQKICEQSSHTRQKKYYESLRSSPERYAAYKRKDSERKKRCRQHMTPEQVEMCRVKDRERQRRYRAKKRGLLPEDSSWGSLSMGKGPSSSILRGLSLKTDSIRTLNKAKRNRSRKSQTKKSQLVVVREMGSGMAEEGDASTGNTIQLKQEGGEDASQIENQTTTQGNRGDINQEINNPKCELVTQTSQDVEGGVQKVPGSLKGDFVVSSAGNIPVLIKSPDTNRKLSPEVVEEIAQVIPCDPPNVEFDWTELDLFAPDPDLDGGDDDDCELLGHKEDCTQQGGEDVGIVSGSARRKAFFPTRHDTAGLTLNAANSLGVSSDCS